VLEWEEFRIRDIVEIKKLIVMTYLMGAYFYEIKENMNKEDIIKLYASIGFKEEAEKIFT